MQQPFSNMQQRSHILRTLPLCISRRGPLHMTGAKASSMACDQPAASSASPDTSSSVVSQAEGEDQQKFPLALSSYGVIMSYHATDRQDDIPVPRHMDEALLVFFASPAILVIVGAIVTTTSMRLYDATALGVGDVLVMAGATVLWLAQEWVIHACLLHSTFDWPGRRIHEGHHDKPYYHVTIDGLPLLAPVMGVVVAVCWAALGGGALSLSGMSMYFCMGLLYEWTHFLVHTRVRPRSSIARAVRTHHMLHHCRNEGYWLSFIVPAVDAVFGTLPARPSDVPLTPLAKAAIGGRGPGATTPLGSATGAAGLPSRQG